MDTHRERARSLLSYMTIDEKIAQLCAMWLELDEHGIVAVKSLVGRVVSGDGTMRVLQDGIGQLTRPYGTHPIDARLCMRGVNAMQRYLVEQTRMGIPALLHEECLAGMMAKGATQFPSGINYGTMWDPELVQRIGKAIGDELSSTGVHQGLAPVLDVSRDVRWGRTEESMGEDPYLVGITAAAYVEGFQGPDGARMATLKHFVGHSFSEGGRNHAPVHVGPRELCDFFALPFEMAVKMSKAGSIMPAYHDIDGEPCTSSSLLKKLVRDRWGFDGLMVSDYEGLSQLCHDHHVASDMAEAAALGIHAGVDIDLPEGTCYRNGLKRALEKGLCDIAEIDAAVERVLTAKFRLGLFEHPYGDEGSILLNPPEHHELSIEAACGSIVLMHNDGTVPLHHEKRIALIGPLADEPYAMFSGYSFPTHVIGSYSLEETVPQGSLTIRKALEVVMGADRIEYARGCDILSKRSDRPVVFPGEVVAEEETRELFISKDLSQISHAVEVASKADVTIMVVGDLAGLFRNGTVGEGSDVSSLSLPGVQQQLIDAVLDTDTHVVLVVVSGRPYDLGRAHDEANAIFAAWMPGEGGGEALADILTGIREPGGRLSVSYATNAGIMPFAYNRRYKSAGVPSHPDFRARYPFGHGLSYTTFRHSGCSVDRDAADVDGSFVIRCIVRNEGYRDGEDVVQLYVRDLQAKVVRPIMELKGFKRVMLVPTQEAEIAFTLPVDLLGYCLEGFEHVVEPGEFEIMLGSSSERIWFRRIVTVTGDMKELPRHWRMKTEADVVYR